MTPLDARGGHGHGHSDEQHPSSKTPLPASLSTAPGVAVLPPTAVVTSVQSPQVEGVFLHTNQSGNTATPQLSQKEKSTMAGKSIDESMPDYFTPDVAEASAANRAGYAARDSVHQSVAPQQAKEYVDDAGNYHFQEAGPSQPTVAAPHKRNPSTTRQQPRRATTTTPLPQYPNQSLAALQKQTYPHYYPPLLNSRSNTTIHPPPRLSTIRTQFQPHLDLLQERRYKPVADTQAQTTGLFTPPTLPPQRFGAEGSDDYVPYPSPFLHPFQQQPRTVTNARKDIDVFSGRKIINHYEILEELGRGVHGKVKLARDLDSPNGQQVAIKIVQRYSKKKRLGKTHSPEDKVKKEVAILKKVTHPNVVQMLEVIDDPQEAKVYIVLEFCEQKEIAWRTLGNSEIVLLENRRLDRESQGLPEEDVHTQDDKALRTATRRLERTRLRPIRAQRARSASHLWSLEYGGESEEEAEMDDDYQRGGEMTEDEAARDISEYRPINELSRSPTAIRTPIRPHTASPHENSGSGQQSSVGSSYDLTRQNSFATPWQRWSMPMNADVSHDLGHRKASTAESLMSQMTQFIKDEFPEDLRYVPTMTIAECRAAFRDALVGLDYLHYHGIIHRDIKPANLLRTRDYRVKISDFGVSYLGKPIRHGEESADTSESESKDIEEDTELAKNVGTPAFYAPELCSLDLAADAPAVTGQIDVWALGVTLYCLLFARTPFLADNEFQLMRRIAMEEVFIPRQRLKAVDLKSAVRPVASGSTDNTTDDKRQPGEYQHEYINEELHDLLKKLFIKDPRRRITIREIKHHPWLLHDIANPGAWIDETDPGRREQGRKIEISSKEVENAVIPINFVKRIKSITSRAGRALGWNSTGCRRGNSSANSSEAGSATTSTLSLPDASPVDSRRRSLRADESIYAALRASRDREIQDHPLSRSVTASPDSHSRARSPDNSYPSSIVPSPVEEFASYRPSMPDRNTSGLSTAGSVRTIRPMEGQRTRQSSVVSTHEEIPEASQTLLEQPGASGFGALWGRSARRSLSRASRGVSPASPSIRNHSQVTEHGVGSPVGGPSLALSNTSVIGHVDLPASFTEDSASGSPFQSPDASRKNSTVSSGALSSPASGGARRLSRQLSEIEPTGHTHLSSMDAGHGISMEIPDSLETPDEQFQHAMEALSRRRVLEIELNRERYNASRNASRPTTASGQDPECPPSPDDKSLKKMRTSSLSPNNSYFNDTNPFDVSMSNNLHTISSVSSDTQLTSGLSQSTSHPSVPSVMSAATSIPDVEYRTEYPAKSKLDSTSSSEGTINNFTSTSAKKAETVSELHSNNVHSDVSAEVTDEDDDDSDADEGFLIMTRRRSHTQGLTRSGSISNAQLARRRVVKQRRKRSGSSHNTMRKTRSHSSSGPEKTSF